MSLAYSYGPPTVSTLSPEDCSRGGSLFRVKGIDMLKSVIRPKRPHISAMTAPMTYAPDQIVMSHPMMSPAIGKAAVQLAAAYGHDAIPLAIRRADQLFEQGRTVQFSDWCLVIVALTSLDRMGQTPSASEPRN